MKQKKRKPIRLQTWMMLLVLLVLIIALAVTGMLIVNETAKKARENQAEKTQDIARAVSRSQVVIEGVTRDVESNKIQTYTEMVQEDTNVDYIVVMDNDHIRRSHPVEENIGQYFVGNDEDKAFEGEQYTSVAEGTLGDSMRAFVPIWNGDKQVGVVAVGILLDRVEDAVSSSQYIVYIGIAAGLIVGGIGAILLARRVKQTLYGLEPREIAQLFQERDVMLSSVREGIIAINEAGIIVIANHAAIELFRRAGLSEHPIGQHVASYLPKSALQQALLNQAEDYDQEQQLHGINIVVNITPVVSNYQTVGSIATFRDKTELTSLAEQLTNAKTYADTLREQTHEFMNRLHVISAMVHTESYEELQTYIGYISENYQKEIGSVSRLVEDPVLASYLLNKLNQFRNNGITIDLRGEHPLPVVKHTQKLESLITMIGNLSDNAMEAVADQTDKYVLITINYIDGQIHFSIQDNGPGLTSSEKEAMFQKGTSTKGNNRGFGLFLTKKILDELGGVLEVTSEKGEGTVFDVIIPDEGSDNV
ncbi:CitB family two-component system sensor histidine kinase MalK [Virgibacillus halotolerans]|uniref:DcuS/MalK family sensor histidine kinase n=1 Tax=Virgibacillus halotolerans TaxID=1071053 RepID=UPI001961ED96|nr:DcuS/MalK family sensor histidine kinase [Virgibacillus halotolerans]MBM7599271.1 CitB family two-component system sensor histidine kinase MalK [Virgibacillus halotolerans]